MRHKPSTILSPLIAVLSVVGFLAFELLGS